VLGLAAAAAVGWSLRPAPARADDPVPLDPRLQVDGFTLSTPRQPMQVESTRLRAISYRRPGVLVMPERSGPSLAFTTIARRLALEGMITLVPDLPSSWGVHAGASNDQREAFNRASVSDLAALVASVADHLQRMPECNGILGVVAFQWGSSQVLPLLQQPGRVRAAVLFDAAADRTDRWAQVQTPLQMHVPDQDPSAASHAETMEKRMIAAGRVYEQYHYPGMALNFALETSPRAYNKDAAELAFDRMVRFLKKRLV
jgi:carboxymethylenebutenolidase